MVKSMPLVMSRNSLLVPRSLTQTASAPARAREPGTAGRDRSLACATTSAALAPLRRQGQVLQPFQIEIPEADLRDLRERLARTRLVHRELRRLGLVRAAAWLVKPIETRLLCRFQLWHRYRPLGTRRPRANDRRPSAPARLGRPNIANSRLAGPRAQASGVRPGGLFSRRPRRRQSSRAGRGRSPRSRSAMASVTHGEGPARNGRPRGPLRLIVSGTRRPSGHPPTPCCWSRAGAPARLYWDHATWIYPRAVEVASCSKLRAPARRGREDLDPLPARRPAFSSPLSCEVNSSTPCKSVTARLASRCMDAVAMSAGEVTPEPSWSCCG
jgi:hypothetical protein